MTEAWKNITNDTIKHVWHPLLPGLVSASTGKRQHKTNLLREAVEAARNIPAPGFVDVDEANVCELLEPDETSAEEMIEENELEVMAEEEKNTETVEEKIVTAGYLSRKITDLAQMKNYLCETGSSESEWVHKVLPLLKKLNHTLSETYSKKVNERRQTVITGYFNRRRELCEKMTNLDGNEEQGNISDDENIESLLGDLDGFTGFQGKEENADERITKLIQASREAGEWRESVNSGEGEGGGGNMDKGGGEGKGEVAE
ncbi:hypothetical protein Pmani_003608 [Petrolisthes manimaculis]|uniref:Uncharacterized protein n=1 Tax=Petrolisthes manimaculis TaxID=1843537 RepID=A0AAE1QFY4_9EUCA|nr:hypothetical protein Pmani_003608 [Petrolisthes manimaculis]